MEENLITIDLNKNLIIPIKEPFDKKQLVEILANHWKYDEGKKVVQRKSFEGSVDDFLTEFEGQNFSVIAINGNDIVYDIEVTIPHEQTRTEWVISKYLKPSTDVLITVLLELQTKEFEDTKKAEIDAVKNQVAEQLELIRDISLQ